MGERVHARRGRDRGWQVEGQFGVGEYRVGEQGGREDDSLDMRRVVGNDRRAPHLRAGTRGGRNRNEAGQRLRDRARLRVVPRVLENVAGVYHHQRDGFCDIERGSATDSDDAVGAVRVVGRHAFHDLAADRVSQDARENAVFHGAQIAQERGEHR